MSKVLAFVAMIVAMCMDISAQDVGSAERILQAHSLFGRIDAIQGNEDQCIVAYGENGYALYSTDEGATWDRLLVPQPLPLRSLTLLNDTVGFALYARNQGFYITTDCGKSWREISGNEIGLRDDDRVLYITARKDTAFMSTFQGKICMVTNDKGHIRSREIFHIENTPLPLLSVSDSLLLVMEHNAGENRFLMVDRRTGTAKLYPFQEDSIYRSSIFRINTSHRSFAIEMYLSRRDTVHGGVWGALWEIPFDKSEESILHIDRNWRLPMLIAEKNNEYKLLIAHISHTPYRETTVNTFFTKDLHTSKSDSLFIGSGNTRVKRFWSVAYETASGKILIGGDDRDLIEYDPRNGNFREVGTFLPGHQTIEGNQIVSKSPNWFQLKGDTILAYSSYSTVPHPDTPSARQSLLFFVSNDGGKTFRHCFRETTTERFEIVPRYQNTETGHFIFSTRHHPRRPRIYETFDWGETWAVRDVPVQIVTGSLRLNNNIPHELIFSPDGTSYLLWGGRDISVGGTAFSILYSSSDNFNSDLNVDTLILWEENNSYTFSLHQFADGSLGFLTRFLSTNPKPVIFIRKNAITDEWSSQEIEFGIFNFTSGLSSFGGTSWLTTTNSILRSTDHGQQWTTQVVLEEGAIVCTPVFETSDGSLWVAVRVLNSTPTSYFYRSDDAGNSWQKMTFTSPHLDTMLLDLSYCTPFLSDERHISFIAGKNIATYYNIFESNLSSSERGLGVYSFVVRAAARATTSVPEASIEALSDAWLYAPAPNPATTAVRVDVRLLRSVDLTKCSLALYDIRTGRLLLDASEQLRQQAYLGGRTTIELSVAYLPSGAYLLQLSTEKFIKTQKIVISR